MNTSQFERYKESCYHRIKEHEMYENGYCCQYKDECEYKYCFVKNAIDKIFAGELTLWIEPNDGFYLKRSN
jgi:hypothetical protein